LIATVVWNQIRLTRANQPGRARADVVRRQTYTAALEQFDELFVAAETIGPASRPLPLFYALSQAGRAIAAAYDEEPNFDSHGLSWVAGDTVLTSRVSPKSSGAFVTVARA